MGDPNAVTPNLDRLAADGVTFTRAVSNCPWCTPFRASLHTGLYSHQCCIQNGQRLDPALPTIAGVLGAAGYDTAHFGKWHLDGAREADDLSKRPDLYLVPKQRRGGFGTWIGYENNPPTSTATCTGTARTARRFRCTNSAGTRPTL